MSANHPAFPLASGRCDGLTKRELFAAMVYQQLLHGAVLPPGFDAGWQLEFTAQRSIECADALIAALGEQK